MYTLTKKESEFILKNLTPMSPSEINTLIEEVVKIGNLEEPFDFNRRNDMDYVIDVLLREYEITKIGDDYYNLDDAKDLLEQNSIFGF